MGDANRTYQEPLPEAFNDTAETLPAIVESRNAHRCRPAKRPPRSRPTSGLLQRRPPRSSLSPVSTCERLGVKFAGPTESIQNPGGLESWVRFLAHGERLGLVPKLVWRVKLVAELRPGVMTEIEVARIERDEQSDLADLGLRLAETKQITAALQAEIVPEQVAAVGERRRHCSSCGHKLAGKGHYPVTFRSLFGDVPVRVRRLLACSCHVEGEAKSFGVLDFGRDAVTPELAYVTARYAALAPFGRVAGLLSELLPISGAQNAGTVRNRTRRVGKKVVRQHATEIATQTRSRLPVRQPRSSSIGGRIISPGF